MIGEMRAGDRALSSSARCWCFPGNVDSPPTSFLTSCEDTRVLVYKAGLSDEQLSRLAVTRQQQQEA